MKQLLALRKWQNLILGLVCLNVMLISCQIGSSNKQGVPIQTNFTSNVQKPKLVGKYKDGYNPMGAIVVQDDYAYIANGQYGLLIIDISDPTKPVKVTDYEVVGDANHLTVVDNYVYLTDKDPTGLWIIDVTEPENTQNVSFLPTFSNFWVTVDKSYAYLGDGADGLTVADISNPQQPIEVSSETVPRRANSIEVVDKYAYIVEWESLYVVDISDPTQLVEVGSYDGFGYANDIEVQGNYAYVAEGEVGLAIVDISDPHNPTLISQYQVPETRPHQDVAVYGIAQSVKVVGDYAYLVDLASLQVIDISDPTKPTLVAFYNDFGQAVDVDVVGDYIYVISLSTLTIWEVPKFDKIIEK